MALNPDNLRDDLIAALVTPKESSLTNDQQAEMEAFCEKLANAVDTHIKRGRVTVNHSNGTPETVYVQ